MYNRRVVTTHTINFNFNIAHFPQGDVWICMELLTTSLDKFYKTVFENEKTIPENVLGKITVAVSEYLENLFLFY